MENLADLLRKAGDTTKSNVIKSSQDQVSTILKILGDQKDTFSQTTKENSLLEELWFNLGGDNWKDVINVKRFVEEKPDQYSYLSSFETKRDVGRFLCSKIRAFLRPPEDGEYIFKLISDDSSILQMAQTGSKNFRTITEADSYTGYNWNQSVSSAKIFLRKKIFMKFRSFIKKAEEKIFVQLGGNCLPESKKILSMANTFQHPSTLKIRLSN